MPTRVPKCDQCEQLCINGIVTHELGCPNSYKVSTPCSTCDRTFIPKYRGDKQCTNCKRDGR
jgi:hypothetical protein